MTDIHITVIGAGAMGTALCQLVAQNGYNVMIWAFEPELVDEINHSHTNSIFLPDVELPSTIRATSSLAEAIGSADFILSVTPSQVLRTLWKQAAPHLSPNAVIVSASKGVETSTTAMMSEVFAEIIPDSKQRLAYLSGPSFAKEIVAGHPTAVVVASEREALAKQAQEILSTSTFRVYTTDDVIGVELGGALKNVIAIAVGAAEGLGLGTNSRAALITRGLAEISRLAVACGANPLTLAGLAGTGDLILTCTGHLSRNLQVGIRLGKGESLSNILDGMKMVAEGVQTARSSLALARSKGIEMPITQVVAKIIDGKISPKDAVTQLMTRKLRAEREY
jgi:glycerol-3-phosphate dehydrogenase (NAD(P)+)